jgi:protein TonB
LLATGTVASTRTATIAMNTLDVTHSAILSDKAQATSNALTFTGVVLLHVLGLAWAAQHLSVTEPVITPPSVVGVLVAPEPAPVVPKPLPPPPRPEPKPAVKPTPTPTPKPKPTPAPKPEAVRETISEPVQQAAPSTPASPAPSAAPVQQAAPVQEAPAPVTPPRTDAAHLNNPAPQYPALSRRLGEQGRVMLDVYILPDGSVGEIKLNRTSGFPRLDNAALQAVKSWKYVPARRGDKPIPYWYVQPVSFVLNN